MKNYRRLKDDNSYYTYIFPELTEEDIMAGVNDYDLDYYCEVSDGSVLGGKLDDLKRFAEEYFQGYSLASDYLKKTSRKVRSARYL